MCHRMKMSTALNTKTYTAQKETRPSLYLKIKKTIPVLHAVRFIADN